MQARALAATAHDLASFHAERAAIYRVLAGVVGVPPTPRAVQALHDMLDEARLLHSSPLRKLANAVDGDGQALVAEYFELLESEAGLPDLRCSDPECEVRSEAFRAAGRTEDQGALSELLVLSHLAEQNARAIRQGDFARAAELSSLQHRFVEEHGSTCFEELARALLQSGFSPYVAAARLLTRTVADDLRLLDAEPFGARLSAEPKF